MRAQWIVLVLLGSSLTVMGPITRRRPACDTVPAGAISDGCKIIGRWADVAPPSGQR